MFAILRILLVALGVSAVAIALMDMSLGAHATASFFEAGYSALTGWPGKAQPWPPTMDNEMRFYAAPWGAYGVVLIWTARDLAARLNLVPWLAAVFFTGGVGRVISLLSVGPPDPFFSLLMVVELATPPVLVLIWLGARRRA